jgi:hypothetical protein
MLGASNECRAAVAQGQRWRVASARRRRGRSQKPTVTQLFDRFTAAARLTSHKDHVPPPCWLAAAGAHDRRLTRPTPPPPPSSDGGPRYGRWCDTPKAANVRLPGNGKKRPARQQAIAIDGRKTCSLKGSMQHRAR